MSARPVGDRPRAKVNLALAVGPRRADGFHELRSVFLRIGLSDSLRAQLLPTTGTEELTVSGDAGCPPEENIVLRAARLVRARGGPGASPRAALGFDLVKAIPVAAGLGGGSSDAASAIALACAAWGIDVPHDQRLELAAELGSDVPFFASGAACARVTGRGDRLEPLRAPDPGAGLLLVVPAARLSTAAVFAAFDGQPARGQDALRVCDELVDALGRGMSGTDLAGWGPRLRDANDLWPAAVSRAPGLASTRDALEQTTGVAWMLSGSGPTLFALYPARDDAVRTALALERRRSGALHGATLIATDLAGPDPAWRLP